MNMINMKSRALVLAAIAILVLASTPLFAQGSEEERRARMEQRREMMEQRRAEFLENNPEAAARMEARRAQREAFLENNPEAATRMEARRERMREAGRPPRPPEFDGGRRRPGPGPRGRFPAEESETEDSTD